MFKLLLIETDISGRGYTDFLLRMFVLNPIIMTISFKTLILHLHIFFALFLNIPLLRLGTLKI